MTEVSERVKSMVISSDQVQQHLQAPERVKQMVLNSKHIQKKLQADASADADAAGFSSGMDSTPAVNKQVYDDWAPTYTDDVRKWGYDMPEQVATLLRAITTYDAHADVSSDPRAGLPSVDSAVLDAGCGDGLSGLALKAAGFSGAVVGVDISPKLLAIAATRRCYAETQEVDMSQPLPFASGSFGIVSCTGVLTYLEPESGVLQEFVRVCKRGGLVCFTNRTDKMEKWAAVTQQLVDATVWEKVHVAAPLPYLPGNPEYGEKVRAPLCGAVMLPLTSTCVLLPS